MSNILRENRAIQVESQKFRQILEKLRQFDYDGELIERRFTQCCSGSREINTFTDVSFQSGNEIVDKCVTVFVNLAIEVDFLQHEARSKFFGALLLYGEDAEGLLHDEKTIETRKDSRAGVMEMMSNFFPLLYNLLLFVGKCQMIVKNILLQLHGFYNLSTSDFPNARDRPLTRVWRCLGDILCVLMTLDEIIIAHPILKEHWKFFYESMQLVQHNLGSFVEANTTEPNIKFKKLQPLLGIITQVHHQIISAKIFETCCQQNFPDNFATDRAFLEHFQNSIFDILTQWERLSRDDIPDKKRLTIIVCLTIFHYKLTRQNFSTTSNTTAFPDKKLLKGLFATYKRILTFHLVGDILWTPIDFLLRNIPSDIIAKTIDRKTLIAIDQRKATLIDKQLEVLASEVQQLQNAVNEWKAELKMFVLRNSTLASKEVDKNATIGKKCICVLKGARIADNISRLIKFVLNSCLAEDRVFPKSSVQYIFRLIELLNSISMTLNFYWPLILDWMLHACLLCGSNLLSMLSTIRSQLLLSQTQDSRILDLSSAIYISSLALCGTPTRLRLIICAIALELANYTKTLHAQEVSQIDDFFIRLDAFTNVGLLLSRVTDFSFFYWHRSLTGIYFESIVVEKQLSIENIRLFCDALNQSCVSQLFNSARHCEPDALRRFFQNEVFALFKEKLLNKLYTEVEIDLRLSSHRRQELTTELLEKQLFPALNAKNVNNRSQDSNLQLSASKLSNALGVVQFLCAPIGNNSTSFTLRIGNRVLNVREFITAHLNANFYNLATVALHDCETYTRMRALAQVRYYFLDLNISSHLPYMAIDQGLDIVMIMRNIHMFVDKYSYDLNEQMFVERNNKSRVLNVMLVDQIVNSIKTHGFGILNSSVHHAYQYLKTKLQLFSQFLFDDQIKSLLVKEIRFYRDHIDQLNEMYPLKRAENLHILLRKVGVMDGGKSFLDKFRMLITQIGNTLALIRMLCVGAVESCAYAAQFTQKCDIVNQLDDVFTILKDENVNSVGEVAEKSAKVLQELARTANEAFSNVEDFVEILLTVFAKEFRNYEKFSHLRNFFIIIPVLSINYVEHIFACRNRLGKRLGANALADNDYTFVDDGFSFGIAYLLKLLNQDFFFDSLNWFSAVRLTLSTELKAANDAVVVAQKKKLRDESFIQALVIKASHSEELLNDYEYLEHTLSTALIFFRVKDNNGTTTTSAAFNTNLQQQTDEEESFLEDF